MKRLIQGVLLGALCAAVALTAGVVVAQIPTEATGYRNPQCAVPSYTIDGGLYDRYGLAQESVNRLSSGAIRDNLSARLEYVYEEINIRCLEEMVGNPGGYMLTKADVEARFAMYQESVGALRTLNDVRPAKKTELISRLGVVRDALDGFALPAEACPALPTANATYTPSNTFAVTASVTNGTENNSFDLALDDTLSWAPDITETLYETSGQDICEFSCNETFAFVDEAPEGDHRGICGCPTGTHEYEGVCVTNACQGTEPTGATYVSGASEVTSGPAQTWAFVEPIPPSTTCTTSNGIETCVTTDGNKDSLRACQYTCADDYAYSGSGDSCINTKNYQCPAKPSNSTWNTDSDGNADGQYAQSYTDATGWQPADTASTTYDATSPYAQCSYRCNSGYHDYNNSCISNTCGGTTPTGKVVKGPASFTSGAAKTWTRVTHSNTLQACEWRCSSGATYNATVGKCITTHTYSNPQKSVGGTSYPIRANNTSATQRCEELHTGLLSHSDGGSCNTVAVYSNGSWSTHDDWCVGWIAGAYKINSLVCYES